VSRKATEYRRNSTPPHRITDDEKALRPDVLLEMLKEHDFVQTKAGTTDRLAVPQKDSERRIIPFREVLSRITGKGFVSGTSENGE